MEIGNSESRKRKQNMISVQYSWLYFCMPLDNPKSFVDFILRLSRRVYLPLNDIRLKRSFIKIIWNKKEEYFIRKKCSVWIMTFPPPPSSPMVQVNSPPSWGDFVTRLHCLCVLFFRSSSKHHMLLVFKGGQQPHQRQHQFDSFKYLRAIRLLVISVFFCYFL